VLLTDAAHGEISNNVITSNVPGFNGATVAAYRGVTLKIRGGNVISNISVNPIALDPEHGVTVRQDLPGGSSVPDQILGNAFINNMTNVDVRDIDIVGNVEVQIHSVFRPRDNSGNTTVTGDIRLRQDSAAVFPAPGAKVTGRLICEGAESSFGGSGVFEIMGGIFCTGF
jgi:hypothetical protein